MNNAMAAAELNSVQSGIDPPVCEGFPLFSGRHSTATATDSRKSNPKRGAIPGMLTPRSRIKANAMKFSGTSRAANVAAIRPGPE